MSSMINPNSGCFWSYATKWTIEYGDDINNMTILETKETNKLEDRGVYKIFPTKEFIFKVFRFSTISRTYGWYGLHYFDLIGNEIKLDSVNYKKVHRTVAGSCCLLPLADLS